MIVIRECRGFEELQACVDLQIEVWGYSDGDVIPRRVFLVAQKIGGQAIGAFDVRAGNGEQGIGNRDGGRGTKGLGARGTRDFRRRSGDWRGWGRFFDGGVCFWFAGG